MDATRRDNPRSLVIVAWLFILGGAAAVIEVLLLLTRGQISINLGVLGLFIGPGLLAHKRAWRTWALVFLWLGFIVMPIWLIAVLAGAPVNFKIFGVLMGFVPTPLALILGLPWFLLTVWQYRVLTNPAVKQLFFDELLPLSHDETSAAGGQDYADGRPS